MILEAFIAQVEAIAQASPVYRLGGDGSDGTCDCIGLVIGAIRQAGGAWMGTHGSNYAARYEMRELLPVTDAGELCLGDVVYKARTPGQAGYALPERYKNDPDQRDYYHVGVVTATSPLEITHCTGPGIVRDTKLGKWVYRGRLKKVDYCIIEIDYYGQQWRRCYAAGDKRTPEQNQRKDLKEHLSPVCPGGRTHDHTDGM